MTPRPNVVALVAVLFAAGCQAAPVHLEVRGRAQGHSLSCESRSACDLLAFYGLETDEDAFFARLPRSDNPEEGFVGSVDDPGGGLPPRGYGVYERPVAGTLEGFGLPVRVLRDAGLHDLRAAVAGGRPVIVWATSQLDAPAPVLLTDGRGRSFVAVPGEHTFLVVGYDLGRVRLLDPATGKEKEVSAGAFDRSWAALGRRAIVPRSCPATGPGP